MSPTLEPATRALRNGSIVVLVDDVASPRRAFLVTGATAITASEVCALVNAGRGVILAALPEERAAELRLPLMHPELERSSRWSFTVSVEAREGVTTGISANDRAQTLRTLARTADARRDLVSPGHIFPLRARSGGVLVRPDLAEAAVDLMALAGLPPTAAVSHCLDDSGELLPEGRFGELSTSLGAPIVTISELVGHRLRTEPLVELIAKARLPIANAGELVAYCFRSRIDHAEHIALVKGDLELKDADGTQVPVLVRVQAEYRLGDLGLTPHDGLERMHLALRGIAAAGRGVFVYIRHPRTGALRRQAVELAQLPRNEKQRNDTSLFLPPAEMALREHGVGAQILHALGVRRAILLTGTQRALPGLDAFGIEIVSRQPFSTESSTGEPQ